MARTKRGDPRLRIGLELLTPTPTACQAGTFFETWLLSPRGYVTSSLGQDLFLAERRLRKNGRFSATGRDARAAARGKARRSPVVLPATMVDADLACGDALVVGLHTNRFLHLTELTDGLRLALVVEGQPRRVCSLHHPLVQTEQVAPGQFLIELGRVLAAGDD
jgi:hypothetical protein